MSLGHLRPLSFGEILDSAFVLYRRHFATLFTTALIPLLPIAPLVGAMGYMTAGLDEETASASLVPTLVAVYPVMILGMLVMWGALIHQSSRAVEGGIVDRGEAYRVAFRRMLPLLGAGILSFLLVALGMVFLIIPGIVAMTGLFAVMPAVVVEGKGVTAALSRSWALARGAKWRVFGLLWISTIIISLPSMLVGMATAVLAAGAVLASDPDSAASALSWYSALSNVTSILISALTTPFFALVMTVLYYDRRVRTEALDLEVATERLGAAV